MVGSNAPEKPRLARGFSLRQREGGWLPLSATASDDGSVTRVEFLVDGTQVGQDYTSPYAYDWPVTAGTHNVQARAIDNLGVTTTTAAIGIFGNQAPTVALTSPAGGAYYAAGATVPLAATAGDADGTIARVEFWVDGAKVADDTSSPYAWNWTMASGSHTLQAKAVDDRGAVTGGGTATIQSLPANATALTRQYFYNAYQELCGVDEPETGVTLMGYDGAGNLAWSASGLPAGTACSSDGNTTAINARKAARTYDARNRIATLSFPDLNGNQSWTYTPDGLPASVTTYNDGGASSVVNSYLYNRRRLPVSETQQVDSLTASVGYGYDPNGHLSALTYPDSLTVAYAPNALGQPTQAGSYATNVTYYPNGAIQQFTYGNGIVHTLTQNARGLPDRSRDANGTTSIHDDSYDYDPVGNVLAISDAVSGNRGDRDMVYDDLNRLTSATSPMFGTATYTYDVVDNLRHVTVTGGTQVRDQDYCYDAANRLTNIKTAAATYCEGATVVGLGYDVQGNLANKSGVNYTFDYGNRLRAGGPETYRYDVQGRRARSNSSAGLVYSLYAQSGQLLFQRDERSGKRRQYVYLGGSLVAESDVPLAGGTATVTYQHTDALGSPVATTNASKTVLQRSEYEPYGYLLNRPMQDGPGYTGHVTDAATGLVYMQQRYMDPLIGQRFLSVDPVTAYSPGGAFNQYWYASANPYGFFDPDGRQSASNSCPNMKCNQDRQRERQRKGDTPYTDGGGVGQVQGYPESGTGSWRASNDGVFSDAAAQHNTNGDLQPGDDGYIDPQTLKAWAMIESGGSKTAFLSDPFQVNVPGDWVPEKATYLGLSKGQQMTPATSAEAAIRWWIYKGYVHDKRGVPTTWRGNTAAFERYNGNGRMDRKWNGALVPHYVWYAKQIQLLREGM